jgi:hypothetical protein
MDGGGTSWGIITILGPLLLILAIAWAVLRNRTSKGSADRTEQATRDLYKEEERARREGHEGDL